MLYNSGVRHFALGIVYNRHALVVFFIQKLCFKLKAAVFKLAETVGKVFVYRTCVNAFISHLQIILTVGKKIGVKPYLHTFEQLFYKLGIAAARYALVAVVKIVVIIGEPYRQALYYKRGQLAAVSAPLLFGVALYKFCVNIPSHKAYSLFFKIFRLALYLGSLLIKHFSRLLWGGYTEHF